MTPSQNQPTKPKANPKHLVAGILLPGLGHWLAGRRQRAIFYAALILGLWAAGMVVANFTAVDRNGHPIYFLMQALVAGPTLLVHLGDLGRAPLIGDNVGVREQIIGITYQSVAGFLNLLSVLELTLGRGSAAGSIADGTAQPEPRP